MAEWDASFSCFREIEKYQRTGVDRGNGSIVSSLLFAVYELFIAIPGRQTCN